MKTNKNLRFLLPILSTFAFFTIALIGIQTGTESALAQSECHLWTPENGSSVPPSFGSPWDAASELIAKVVCNGDSIDAELGNGSNTHVIWHTGYITHDGKNWDPVEITGSSASSDSKWFYGNASFTATMSDIELRMQNYVAAYQCDYTDGSWKCGSQTGTPLWTLQSFMASNEDGGEDTGGDDGNNDDGNDTGDDDGGGSGNSACNTVQTIIDDMTLPEDSAAHGYPYDEGTGYVWAGNDAPSWANALHGWGDIHHDMSNSNDTNTAIEVKNIRVYVLSKSSGQWSPLQSSTDVGFGGYAEDFSGSASLESANVSDGGTANKIPHGSVFHFWSPQGAQQLNTGDIGGIFVATQGRLIVADSSQPDDTATARYVMQTGADYYGDDQCCSEGNPNGEVGGGRFKNVTTDWQWFNFTTVPTEDIASNPPPLECLE